MHELTTVGNAGGPLHLGDVTAGVESEAESGGIHHLRRVAVGDHVYAVGAGTAGATHGDRHRTHRLTVDVDDHLVRHSVGVGDELVTDGEARGPVLLAVHPIAQVLAVVVDFDGDLGSGLPELLRTQGHLVLGEPVERAIDLWRCGDGNRIFGCLPVIDRLIDIPR